MRNYLLAIGLMTGNSLDGVDAVLSRFDKDGAIQDLSAHFKENTAELKDRLKKVRGVINETQGDMLQAVAEVEQRFDFTFDQVQHAYTEFLAKAVQELLEKARCDALLTEAYDLGAIDLLGSHGQTCAHFPPSIAKTDERSKIYTVQIGDGQQLADLTGITVVCDFRSDDLMNQGEAAPLAPVHHQHLATCVKQSGHFPIAFCNAGNTGNLSVISEDCNTDSLCVLGWDTGPFNNFPDKLMQLQKNQACDQDGKVAQTGAINESLLKILFDKAVQTADGENYLLVKPPKSSDPEWYRMLPELLGEAPVDGNVLSFEDRLRTATYFSAYIYVHSLTLLPQNVKVPSSYALCGGGWRNPLCFADFSGLLKGESHLPVLADHQEAFTALRSTIHSQGKVVAAHSEKFGFDGSAMEARLFADAAVCRITGEPFSLPSTTGAGKETIAGIIRFPSTLKDNATATLGDWLEHYGSLDLTLDDPALFDSRWNRAVSGWYNKLSQSHREHPNLS